MRSFPAALAALALCISTAACNHGLALPTAVIIGEGTNTADGSLYVRAQSLNREWERSGANIHCPQKNVRIRNVRANGAAVACTACALEILYDASHVVRTLTAAVDAADDDRLKISWTNEWAGWQEKGPDRFELPESGRMIQVKVDGRIVPCPHVCTVDFELAR